MRLVDIHGQLGQREVVVQTKVIIVERRRKGVMASEDVEVRCSFGRGLRRGGFVHAMYALLFDTMRHFALENENLH